jgi:hypothetical protein
MENSNSKRSWVHVETHGKLKNLREKLSSCKPHMKISDLKNKETLNKKNLDQDFEKKKQI